MLRTLLTDRHFASSHYVESELDDEAGSVVLSVSLEEAELVPSGLITARQALTRLHDRILERSDVETEDLEAIGRLLTNLEERTRDPELSRTISGEEARSIAAGLVHHASELDRFAVRR